MKKFLNKQWVLTMILGFVFLGLAIWGFMDTTPNIEPSFFQKNHIIIAIVGVIITIIMGILTIKNLFKGNK